MPDPGHASSDDIELENIRKRYRRRDHVVSAQRYSMLEPAVYMSVQERERVLIEWIRSKKIRSLESVSVLDVGCGNGNDLGLLIRLGARPENLVGVELLAARAISARARLPVAVRIYESDATSVELEPQSFDIVLQSTVFSSILSVSFRRKLAARMWALVKPGGSVMSFDFVYSNPRNPDVCAISNSDVRALFPEGSMSARRLTLAPPIARLVTRLHPSLYSAFNLVPALRTHSLCVVRKALPVP